ncbi:unnamed protein product [Calypogeia fissa]
MVELKPTHEVREGVDVVWQIPPNPRGVFFIAHSANGTPFSYWPSHDNVPQCTGTPEHKVLIKDALEQGYAVIVGKSVDLTWARWPVPNVDTQKTVKILKEWTNEHGLEALPLSGLGSSAGGDYISALPHVIKMQAIVVMISHGCEEAFEVAVAGEYPPTLFVPMTGDQKTCSMVKENAEFLKTKGIPCKIQEAPPLEVNPHFFCQHIDELDEDQSAKLQSVLVEHGILAEDCSVNRVLLRNDAEPYLRKAGILPTGDESQRQKDEETLNEAKKLKADGKAMQAGPGRGGPGLGGPVQGRTGPPPGGRGGPGRGGPVQGRTGPPPGGRGGPGRGGPGLDGPVQGRTGPPPGGRGGPGGGGPGLGGPGGGGPDGGGPGLGGPGRGGPGGGGPQQEEPVHPLASAISNQLIVAQGNHTVTARQDKAIFEWLQGLTIFESQSMKRRDLCDVNR